MLKFLMINLRVAKVAVAVSAIRCTFSGTMLLTSLRWENSFLKLSPLKIVQNMKQHNSLSIIYHFFKQ